MKVRDRKVLSKPEQAEYEAKRLTVDVCEGSTNPNRERETRQALKRSTKAEEIKTS